MSPVKLSYIGINTPSLAIGKYKTMKLLVLSIAIISFFPSMIYGVAFAFFLISVYFFKNGYKYIIFYAFLLMFTLLSFILQDTYYYKGPFLSFLILSSFYYVYFLQNYRYKVKLLTFFMLVHIYLSLIQIPIQLVQFISMYGFNFSMFLTYSSAGDVSYGTIFNSALLADKQLLSIFFLITLKENFTRKKFYFYLLLLIGSFLFIGANHTTLALLTAIGFYLIIHLLIKGSFLDSMKNIVIGTLILLSVLFSMKIMFSSQYIYVANTLNKISDPSYSFGKVEAYLKTRDVFFENPSLVLFGLGSGCYSSRASFILSGEYLWNGEHKLLGIQENELFTRTLYELWNDEIRFNNYKNGTLYQPFSSILTVVSEYGVVIFLLFMSAFFRLFYLIKTQVGRVFILFSFIMLFIDNFLEFPRLVVPAIFYGLYLIDKKNEVKYEYINYRH